MSEDALLTDLYEPHMMQAYQAQAMDAMAVFDFTVRALPQQRKFLVAAGLDNVLDHLEQLHFTDAQLAWLKETCHYPQEFICFLAGLRFTGQVDALPEGTVFFGGTPLLRVSAPIAQAQLVESRIVNLFQFSTMIASKAVRCVHPAAGRGLVDFGLRRAHGAEAALLAARSSASSTRRLPANPCWNARCVADIGPARAGREPTSARCWAPAWPVIQRRCWRSPRCRRRPSCCRPD